MRDPSDLLTPADGPGPGAAPAPAIPRVRRDPLAEAAAAPHRFDFFHLMRLVEAQHADKPRLGTARRPMDEPVRLGQAANLAFAPASLSAVELDDRSGKPRDRKSVV